MSLSESREEGGTGDGSARFLTPTLWVERFSHNTNVYKTLLCELWVTTDGKAGASGTQAFISFGPVSLSILMPEKNLRRRGPWSKTKNTTRNAQLGLSEEFDQDRYQVTFFSHTPQKTHRTDSWNFALTALTIVWRLCNFFATLFTRWTLATIRSNSWPFGHQPTSTSKNGNAPCSLITRGGRHRWGDRRFWGHWWLGLPRSTVCASCSPRGGDWISDRRLIGRQSRWRHHNRSFDHRKTLFPSSRLRRRAWTNRRASRRPTHQLPDDQKALGSNQKWGLSPGW